MIIGIHHVAVVTRDLDRLAAFYCDAMGLSLLFESGWRDSPEMDELVGLENSATRVVMLQGPGINLEIFEYSQVVGDAPAVATAANHAGFAHISFEVKNLVEAMDVLGRKGMTFNGPPVAAPDGSMSACYGRDPDGNIIELMQLAGAGDHWQVGHRPTAAAQQA